MHTSRTLAIAVRYLSGSEVAARLGLHVKTFNRYLREGRLDDFPRPRRLADGVRRWVETEVEQWQLSRPVAEAYAKAVLSPTPELNLSIRAECSPRMRLAGISRGPT